MSGFRQPTMRFGGTVRTCRFVTLSTTANRTLIESNAGEMPFGVSSEGSQDAPVDGASANAAESGDHAEWHGPGETCLLRAGSGGLTCGGMAKPDADGNGIAAGAGDKYGAFVLSDAAEGELADVYVWPGELET